MGRMLSLVKSKQDTCHNWVVGLQKDVKKLKRVTNDRKKRKKRKIDGSSRRKRKNSHDKEFFDKNITIEIPDEKIIIPAIEG
jgi:hypothetical protein